MKNKTFSSLRQWWRKLIIARFQPCFFFLLRCLYTQGAAPLGLWCWHQGQSGDASNSRMRYRLHSTNEAQFTCAQIKWLKSREGVWPSISNHVLTRWVLQERQRKYRNTWNHQQSSLFCSSFQTYHNCFVCFALFGIRFLTVSCDVLIFMSCSFSSTSVFSLSRLSDDACSPLSATAAV